MMEERAIRVLPFSGKHVEWTVWAEKFLARDDLKGYSSVLLGDEKAPSASTTIDESTAEGK